MILAALVGLVLAAAPHDTVRGDSAAGRVPPWWEVSASLGEEVFAQRLSPWDWHGVALRHRGRLRSSGVEGFIAKRHGQRDAGFALEHAMRIQRGAYVALRAQVAPNALVIARSDLSAEWFHTLGAGWEIIPAARLLSFADVRVPIFRLGVGRYARLWYFNGRVSAANRDGEWGRVASAGARRYGADDSPNFVDAVASHGHEVAVLAPRQVQLARTTSAGLRGQHMLSSSVGASLSLSYDANALLPDRYGVGLTTFIRW
jgi:YaiO family outer membrane protein